MKKRFVTVLLASLMTACVAGCSKGSADNSADVEALQNEIDSLKEQLEEKQEEAEDKEVKEDKEAKEDAAAADLEEAYGTLKEWADDNENKLKNAVYYKCVLLDDDDIPEVVLFNEYSGLYAIISVNEKNKVTFFDTINVDGRKYEPNDADRGYWTALDRFSANAADTEEISDSQTFSYNPKEGEFACHYTTPHDGVHFDQTMNEYLELSGSVVMEVGNSGSSKSPSGETNYYAGKFSLGEATKDIYEEYNSDFEYAENFVVKSDCKISLKAAFEEFTGSDE